MGRMTTCDDGALIPNDEYRGEFSEDLYDTIAGQLLGNRDYLLTMVDRRIIECRLPHRSQLLDFVRIVPADETGNLDVTVVFPAKEDDTKYWIKQFTYRPPR
jgi:hypothetical protein